MKNLTGAEIFAVGKWNGKSFSLKDLQGIADTFNKLAEIHQVPLKLGHNDEQPLTDGQPALGWVERVYVRGNKLLADFKDMPSVIAKAIQKRLYRTVSVELLSNVTHKGTNYPYILDAVALLGAEHPAVNTLADLQNLMLSRAFPDDQRLSFSAVAGNPSTGGSDMDLAELTSAVKALQTEQTELRGTLDKTTKERDEFKRKAEQLEADAKAREEKEAAAKVEFSRKSVTDFFEGAVKAEAITPAQREAFTKQLGVDDDERVTSINVDELVTLIGWKPGDDKTDNNKGDKTVFSRDSGDDSLTSENPSDVINDAALELYENGQAKDYFTALRTALRRNPTAAKAWAGMNGEFTENIKGRASA